MKYHETDDYSFMFGNNHYAYDHKEDENVIHLFIKSKPHSSKCPICGQESNKLHATYKRVLQDTPIHCKQTFLHANVYKYECENSSCDCKVFMENLPFAKASQVRTDALNSLILGVSMFLSNEGASKVLALLGVKVSNDTIQSLYDRIEFVDDPNVEEVGIDDVAIRKGQTYATAIYDLKDHHLIALLEGRDAETLTDWLKNHQKIRLVARDRASAYASAINTVLPNCIQVADRLKEKFPIASYVENVFKEFRTIIMGNEPERIDEFLAKYSDSRISTFCKVIKKDIVPVKNAISHTESSGFVEGNNNKFKLLKRIVYGRSHLANLAKKCKLAFMPKNEDFNLRDLLQ